MLPCLSQCFCLIFKVQEVLLFVVLESLFSVFAILPSFVLATQVGDRPHDTHCASPKRKNVSNPDLDGTGVTCSFAASPLISSWHVDSSRVYYSLLSIDINQSCLMHKSNHLKQLRDLPLSRGQPLFMVYHAIVRPFVLLKQIHSYVYCAVPSVVSFFITRLTLYA